MKKLFSTVLGVVLMSVAAISVNAKSTTAIGDWKVGESNENGYATKVSDIVTNLKGADTVYENNTYNGPYVYNDDSKLTNGITEEISVYIKVADILNPNDEKVIASKGALQGFEVTNSLDTVTPQDAGDPKRAYKTEARIDTVKIGDKVYIKSDLTKDDNKYEVTEDGLYTYKWEWTTRDSKVYLTMTVSKDDKVVYNSGELDVTEVGPAFKISPEEIDNVYAGYLWFYGINLENGIDVYSKIPETAVQPEVNSEIVSAGEDVNTFEEILKESLNKFPELKELTEKSDVTIALNAEKVDVEEATKEEFAKVDEKMSLSDFFDISILVKADGQNHHLTELTKAINLSVAIPENIPAVKEGYTRTYYILRKHEDKIEKLDAKISEDGKMISFATDKFSTYAIAYLDSEKPVTANPQTYDGIVSYLIIGSISALTLVGVSLYIHKKKLFN